MTETNTAIDALEYLPAFAGWVQDQRLEQSVRLQITTAFSMDIPLLRFFRHLPEAELERITREGQQELYKFLRNNRAEAFIEANMQRWVDNQLPLLDRMEVDSRDISLVGHLRSRVLKSFIPEYTSDVRVALAIAAEIDLFELASNSRSTDVYIRMLREKVAAEAHFSAKVVNASPGMTYIFDLTEQKDVYLSGNVEGIMGYTVEEVLSWQEGELMNSIYAEDLPGVSAMFGELIEGGSKTVSAEYRCRHKDGRYIWLRSYLVPYRRDESGQLQQILGCSFEITNEKETAAALRKRESQLLEAQAIGGIGSYEWNLGDDSSVSTPQLRKILDFDETQNLDGMLQRVHPDDQQRLTAAIEEAMRTGIYHCEYRYVTRTGEKVIDSNGMVLYDAECRPATMIGTIQDITERKRIEEHLIAQRLELERSNEQLQEFAYVASHDLKEPLRKIAMFCNIIMTSDWDQLSEKTKTNFQKISDSARRMQQLIEGILAYSALSNRDERVEYPLQNALDEALANLEYKLRDSGAQVTALELPVVEAVPFQMQQLFQNLIGNALKFARPGVTPKVEIGAHKADPAEAAGLPPAPAWVRITITDNGIGFDETAQEKIFGLFQRLHDRQSYEGSGLGLAICRRIVENHGGRITATGTSGAGATFTILLPARQ